MEVQENQRVTDCGSPRSDETVFIYLAAAPIASWTVISYARSEAISKTHLWSLLLRFTARNDLFYPTRGLPHSRMITCEEFLLHGAAAVGDRWAPARNAYEWPCIAPPI
jgi:hypothetical protein